MSKKVFFPNLDGLRFVAFLSVFFSHSFYTDDLSIKENSIYQTALFIGKSGIFGVNMFFVLSGFLITYLLMDERERNGKINIGKFYVRRILKIWPLYYAVVIIGFFIIPNVMHGLGETYQENTKLSWYLLFINNLMPVKPATAVLGILWSIAVEEQFYLFWPLIIRFVPRKLYSYLFTFLIVLSFILRWQGWVGYEHTLNCISDLVTGSWIAVLAFNNHPIIRRIASIPKGWNIAIYILGATAIFSHWLWTISFILPFTRIVFACYFGFIIIEQTYSNNSWYKMSQIRFFDFWGKYTYGLYMTHFMVIYAVGRFLRHYLEANLINVLFTQTSILFVLSLLVAYGSFHIYEKPFLRLKERFTYFKN